MNQPTHIIDPDGEVIVILRNANSPFAQALEDRVSRTTLPEFGQCVQSPAEVIKPPQTHSRKLTTKCKKQQNPKGIWTTREAASLPGPAAFPGPAPIRDPVTEQHVAEQPVVEEPAVEEKICEPIVERCFYIRVSAKHLIFASPVFKRMLTGGWKETIEYLQKVSI